MSAASYNVEAWKTDEMQQSNVQIPKEWTFSLHDVHWRQMETTTWIAMEKALI